MSVFLEVDPGEWVASNDFAFAIRDSFPVSQGHVLVISRRAVADWWSATSQEQHAIIELIDDVKRRIDAECSPDGYNVGFNAGSAAGQTIDHLHVHVIPRYTDDVSDPRGGVRHVIPSRGNYLSDVPISQPRPTSLVTPFDGRLRLELLRCLIREDLDRIDLLVSFVMRSGVSLIAHHLDEALKRGARVRLLTTDYLQVTDTSALGFFLDRLGPRPVGQMEARVFSDPSTSFHPKAYIFSSSATDAGMAFIGSSNLSYSGISTGVEWNIETRETRGLIEEFDRLWSDPRSIPLTSQWLMAYDEARLARIADRDDRPEAEQDIASREVEDEAPPEPWSVQGEALSALAATRIDGHEAGLVVMATGLGKTWLAAFDSTRPEFRRVLFIAHREEILSQARDVYRQIRPSGRLTLFVGDEREPDGEVVFASVQSLHRNLAQFDPTAFDYIVVDEFHHAAANTYRRVIGHFRPKFLLGLTATPQRADNADLMALCSDNLVYDCGLVEGVNRQLLSPFRYRAIPDVADYEHIPWRNGRFDLEALTAHVATHERAEQVFDEWSDLGGNQRRTLGFCCTIAHANFMADFFRRRGIAAVAVHSGANSSPRAESLEQLASGALPVVFAVDLFNEGVDVPSIDLVLMLRPTESGVVFLQQLGRGLRRSSGKSRLEVVDLVGNHRGFLLKARLLAELAGHASLTDREALDFLARQNEGPDETGSLLPEGCSIVVEPEVVDLLRELLGPANAEDRLVELARNWADEHDGRRPVALELTLLTGEPFKLKPQGGWFGLLDRTGMLSPSEVLAYEVARDFLLWIEYGSYTKSYKLVTLLAMAQSGNLRTGIRISDLAATSRWMIFRSSELLADLSDAHSYFADLTRPTVSEWESYWRRNPLAALTARRPDGGSWFDIVDGYLVPEFEIPDDIGAAFDEMVREIVEYRLHRYLIGQKARRVGEARKPQSNGIEIDSTFVVETSGGTATSVVIESAGGTKGSDAARNVEYVAGFDVVLARLGELGATLVDSYIDTRSTAGLTISDRRLDLGPDVNYPVDLAAVTDLSSLRRSMLRSMARAGRRPDTKGGGNARKRARLVIALNETMSAAELADALAHGGSERAQRSANDTGETTA